VKRVIEELVIVDSETINKSFNVELLLLRMNLLKLISLKRGIKPQKLLKHLILLLLSLKEVKPSKKNWNLDYPEDKML
jgi:hypothetical protein